MAGCGSSTVQSGSAPGPRGQEKKRGTFKPYTIRGQTYHPLEHAGGFTQAGLASWYGPGFHGKRTANGEVYNMHAMTAAHKILPMQTMVDVYNVDNGRRVRVRINDRGPFVAQRIIDVSKAAASKLGMVGTGTARVRIAAVGDLPNYRDGDLLGTFYVQVGAFTVRNNAERLLANLQRSGSPRSRIVTSQIGGSLFWRVQKGTWPSLNKAEAARDRLTRTYPGAFVIAD